MNRFVHHIEASIVAGNYTMGTTLPAEKDLAAKLRLDFKEVHEGITELTKTGLISVIPGIGIVINDYRKFGSFSILSTLFNYNNGPFEPGLLSNLLELRELIEIQSTRLASQRRTQNHIYQLEQIISQERTIHRENIPGIVDLDYNLHHIITMASGNSIYSLLMNSFKKLYTSLAAVFFTFENTIDEVFEFHVQLTDSIKQKNESQAVEIMTRIIKHGEEHLNMFFGKK